MITHLKDGPSVVGEVLEVPGMGGVLRGADWKSIALGTSVYAALAHL